MSKEVKKTLNSLLEQHTIGKCVDGSLKPSIDSLLKPYTNGKCTDGFIEIPLDIYVEIIMSSEEVFFNSDIEVNENGHWVHSLERNGVIFYTSSKDLLEKELLKRKKNPLYF